MTPALEKCLAIVEAAAAAGERCPRNNSFVRTELIEQLARDGHLLCTVYGDGWRVVEILTGAHAGAKTLPAPKSRKPWRVYSECGCTVDRWRACERARKPRRQTPSLPIITLRECL
jgi:hypothetical protein